MSLLQLPEMNTEHRLGAVQFDLRPDALERWRPEVRAASDDGASLSIYGAIGESWDGEGVTAKRIAGALRSIGTRDIHVNINSPGGDFFEGVAIYNLLREHKAKVTTRIMGLAASAGSVISMAGDDILIGDGAFLMIHNAWAVAVGNRHDLAAAAAQLAPFDAAMAKLYAARTGITVERAAAMMDAETWIDSEQALAEGFATGRVDKAATQHASSSGSGGKKALAMVEASLAKSGYSRTARRDAFRALFSGTPCAADTPATPRAGDDIAALLRTTLQTLQGNAP